MFYLYFEGTDNSSYFFDIHFVFFKLKETFKKIFCPFCAVSAS